MPSERDNYTETLSEKPTIAQPTNNNTLGPWPKGSFFNELERLINYHSLQGVSNTPDFILAQYLKGCLENFDTCVRRLDEYRSP